jgi:hypothetical protein
MIDPQREPLEGMVEVDQAELPFRADNSFFDYRHDPRTVGKMAGHVVLPWIHRVFALMKRWGLGTYHGLRRRPLRSPRSGLAVCRACSIARR